MRREGEVSEDERGLYAGSIAMLVGRCWLGRGGAGLQGDRPRAGQAPRDERAVPPTAFRRCNLFFAMLML